MPRNAITVLIKIVLGYRSWGVYYNVVDMTFKDIIDAGFCDG